MYFVLNVTKEIPKKGKLEIAANGYCLDFLA